MKYAKRILTLVLILCLALPLFDAQAAGSTVTLPRGVKVIEEEAFFGDTSINKVVLPEGLLEIQARAFSNSMLREINLPTSLQYIADDAFDGPGFVTVTVKAGNSYAYNWARDHGYIADAAWKTVFDPSCSVDGRDVIIAWGANELASTYYIYEMSGSTATRVATVQSNNYVQLRDVSVGTHRYVIEPRKGSTVGTRSAPVEAVIGVQLAEELTLSESFRELDINESFTLTASVYPADTDNQSVTWISNNPNVASVNSNGRVTALASGTATITATAADGSQAAGSCVVIVNAEEQPYLIVTHPLKGDILNSGEIEMFNGPAYQTWTVVSNYPVRMETVGNWFYDNGENSFEAGENTYVIYMDDGAPAGTKRTGKVKFYINNSLFATANIYQDGGTADSPTPAPVSPTISVSHPILGDIFAAGTYEMFNGPAYQTWTVTANCNWTLTKSGSWFTVSTTSGSPGTTTVVLNMDSGAAAGETRNGSVTFKINGSTYRTVNFKQVGPAKTMTVSHPYIGNILEAGPIQFFNGGAEQNWTIASNANWSITTSGSWFNVDKTSGSANTESNPTTNLKITMSSGVAAGDYREGSISFYFGSTLYKKVTFYQDGGEEEIDTDPDLSISIQHPFVGDVINASPFMLHNGVGASMTWRVTANFDWKVTVSDTSWISVSPTSGSAGVTSVVLTTTGSVAGGSINSSTLSFKKQGSSSTKASVTVQQGRDYTYDDSFSVSHALLGDVLYQDTIYLYNEKYAEMNWTIMSNVDWSLTKSGSWFDVDRTYGYANTASNQSTNLKITITKTASPGVTNEGYIKFSYTLNGRSRTTKVYLAEYGGPGGGTTDPSYEDTLSVSHPIIGDVLKASSIEMFNGAAEQNWKVTSNVNWSIETTGSWFTVSPRSGAANNDNNPTTNVRLYMASGVPAGSRREGTVAFKVNGTAYATVRFYQDGGDADPSMTIGSRDFGDLLSLSTISLGNVQKTYNLTVIANRSWSIAKSGSWFSVSQASGSADTTATVGVTVNTLAAAGQTLTGSLTFKVGGSTYKTVNLEMVGPTNVVVDPDDVKLPAPTGLTATMLSTTSARLTWNAVSGAKGYNVYRSEKPTTEYSKLNSTLVTSPYTDTTLAAGKTYYYYVAAVSNSNVIGSGSIPYGPVSYNAACSMSLSAADWNPAAAGGSKSFTVAKHGSNDFTVSIVQYNSEGTRCTNVVSSDNHKLAYWLTASKASGSFTLTAAKNYAGNGKTATVTVKCACGATRTLMVNQAYGEPAPASVKMTMSGTNGFTETSSSRTFTPVNHLNYTLVQGEKISVAVTAGSFSRRVTFRVQNPNGDKVYEDVKTVTGNTGTANTFVYTLPSNAPTGSYKIEVYAANSTTAGDDAQFIYVAARIKVNSKTDNSKLDYSDEIWDWVTTRMGLNAWQAAAVVGTMQAESSCCPYNSQMYYGIDNRGKYTFHVGDKADGFGLCQWGGSRKQNLLNLANSKGNADLVWDFTTQMEHFESEWNNGVNSFRKSSFNSMTSMYTAIEYLTLYFEGPSMVDIDTGADLSNSWPGMRYERAKRVYKAYTGSDYSEPALSFDVTYLGNSVLNSTGYQIDSSAAAGYTGTLKASTNYFWRLSVINLSHDGWLTASVPSDVWRTRMSGYAKDNTRITVKVNAVPPAGTTYTATLRFELYRGSHVYKDVPVSLTHGTSTGSKNPTFKVLRQDDYSTIPQTASSKTFDQLKTDGELKDLYYDKTHTIKTSGCGLCAIVNAVKYLTGNSIDVHTVRDYSYDHGFCGPGGTNGGLYKSFANSEYGTSYGFKNVKSCYLSDAIQYLNQGCVGIVGVKRVSDESKLHIICIAAYDANTKKFLILDSAGDYTGWTRSGKDDGSLWAWQSITNGAFEFNSDVVINGSLRIYGIAGVTYPEEEKD